jgi:hypothetical protein
MVRSGGVILREIHAKAPASESGRYNGSRGKLKSSYDHQIWK